MKVGFPSALLWAGLCLQTLPYTGPVGGAPGPHIHSGPGSPWVHGAEAHFRSCWLVTLMSEWQGLRRESVLTSWLGN